MSRRLTQADRVLADRNLGVIVENVRSAAGQAFAAALAEKGYQLLRQPELVQGSSTRWHFVLRPAAEHTYQQTLATVVFEYGAASGRAPLPEQVELWDLGADLSMLDVLTLPFREASRVAETATERVQETLAGAARGAGDAAAGLASFIRFAQITGLVLGGAVIVGGLVYLVRTAGGR